MNKILEKIVKEKCNITWEEEETNKRIAEIVEDAIITIKNKIGISDSDDVDFSIASQERTLFKNYCFYEWNNKASEFDRNYANEIMQLRQKYEVKHDNEENEEL